jgi:atypical dual specificity phosphatase
VFERAHIHYEDVLCTVEYKPRGGAACSFIEGACQPDLYAVAAMPGLFIGSQDAALNHAGIAACSVTHLLNVATGVCYPSPPDCEVHLEEMLDSDQCDLTSHLPRCFAVLDDALAPNSAAAADDERPRNGGVLVHCNAGVSRSAAVCIAYLIARLGLSYEEAYAALKSAKPDILPNATFVCALREFANANDS